MQSEKLSNMNSQVDSVNITDLCAMHFSYLSHRKKPLKRQKHFSVLYNPDEKVKVLENLEQQFPFVFPSYCVNDDANHFPEILIQTNKNKSNYSEVKKKGKILLGLKIRSKKLLENRNVFCLELSASPKT